MSHEDMILKSATIGLVHAGVNKLEYPKAAGIAYGNKRIPLWAVGLTTGFLGSYAGELLKTYAWPHLLPHESSILQAPLAETSAIAAQSATEYAALNVINPNATYAMTPSDCLMRNAVSRVAGSYLYSTVVKPMTGSSEPVDNNY